MMKFMDPSHVTRMMELAHGSYRPKLILDLKRQIEGAKRAAELQATVSGKVDEDRVRYIVGLMLELDGLYAAWAEGRIS